MNLPKDFENRMKNMLGGEYEEFERSFCTPDNHIAIRINTAKKGARDAALKIIGDSEPVQWCADGYYTDKSVISGNHPYHNAGLFYFQEPSAMSAVEALDIRPCDKVLDLCASPGGKSTQVGAKLGKGGILVANEISAKRAQILAENIERFGIGNALVTNESPSRLEKHFANFFDKIIVDAPCSGEGMFRKEPQAVDEWSIEHTASCAQRQLLILDSAEKMLAEDGYIVYSTCTFAPCENEGVISKFLDSHSDFELADIPKLAMLEGGVGAWADSARDMTAARRIFPHRQKGEGHFVALLVRRGNAECKVRKKSVPRTDVNLKNALALYRKFESETLTAQFDGEFALFGENLYRLPDGISCVDNIKTVRAGLHMGVCRKNRFEPSHALCLALDKNMFRNSVNYAYDSAELAAYMRGETLGADCTGWTAVLTDGYPIGWGKGSDGVIKNHFPKYLRLKR